MSEQRISQASTQHGSDTDTVKPPIPKWMYAFVNPAMAAVLRSPLHRMLSGSLMLLSFRGRSSGKQYTIPVGYQQHGDKLYIFSHSKWWQNLPGQTVTLRLRGKDVRGTARRLEDAHEIAALVRRTIAKQGPKMAERMGLLEYADPNRSGPLPQRTKFFEITLEQARS